MIDPDVAKQAARAPRMTIRPNRVKAFRAFTGGIARALDKRPPGIVIAERLAGGIPVRWYDRVELRTEPSPAVIYIHGGGLIMGNRQFDDYCGTLAVKADLPVFSVGYRLAPEHPFPAALDDIVTAVGGIVDAAPQLGIDVTRLVIAGASAGGGLAAAAAQRLTDAGVDLAGQLLVYPMLDDRTAVRDDIDETEHKVWNRVSNHTGWSAYLGQPAGPAELPDYAVPARREDLDGLPPAWIGVGTADLFHDECVDYAQRLEAAGVHVTLHVVEGAVHGFDALRPVPSTAVDAFVNSQLEFVAGVVGSLAQPVD